MKQRLAKAASLFLLIAALSVSFAGLAYPLYVMRPFRAQGARELAAALAIIQRRPPIEIACALCALAGVLLFLAFETRRSRRRWAVAGACLACLFAIASRVNVYELLFHPAGHPLFVTATQSKVDADDMVMAVKVDGVAHAYPIRTIAYHHIVNDFVGHEPILATY